MADTPVHQEWWRGGVEQDALPLDRDTDLDPLLTRIGNARYVLIGEASHGTHEYYAWRALCWFDETTALSPLHGVQAEGDEMETWPSGG